MGRTTENYYKILNIRSDCSDKEIKAAYVQLSKKFHPDVKSQKTDSQQTAHFLKITEAYQTLSKPKLRSEYDRSLQAAQSMRSCETFQNEVHRPWEIKPNYASNPGPYYGINGLRKTTNFKVALILVICGIFAGVIGVGSVKKGFALKNKYLDDVSAKANEHHQKIRADVENSSRDEQLQRVIHRLTKRIDE